MTMGQPISVLVCDTETLFADALGRALAREPDLAPLDDRPATAEEALDAIVLRDPDVALIDYWLPGATSPHLVAQVSGLSSCRAIVLSSLIAPHHIQEVLAAGAAGLLPKGITLAQAADAVRQAHSGEPLVHAGELAHLFADIQARGDDVDAALARVRQLTPRQLQVLTLLGRGHPPEEVAQRLGISAGTVKVHIHRILTDTGTSSATEAVALARYCGLTADLPSP